MLERPDESSKRLVIRRLGELKPHPSYLKHRICVSAPKLAGLAELGDDAFRDPILITRDCTIIDGYARVELAKLHNRVSLNCIEYDLSELEALSWLVQTHLPSRGYASFTRVLLALEMEPLLKEKARSNQQIGGQRKGSSNLTEAERVEVRNAVAAAARVSVGTFSKAKQLISRADPQLQAALRDGEISIHRAWQWSQLPRHEQRQNLALYRQRKGMERTVKQLISKQLKRQSSTQTANRTRLAPTGCDLARHLSGLAPETLTAVKVVLIKGPGKTIAITEELAGEIGLGTEFILPC